MWKRTRKSTQKAAPINATVHDVRHVTQRFYLLYKPENSTLQYIRYNRSIKEIWVYFSHCVHDNIGLYSVDGVCFTIRIKPGVMTRTEIWAQRQRKNNFHLGQRLQHFKYMKSPRAQYDYTLLQKTLMLLKPQRVGVVTPHFYCCLYLSL